MSDKREISVSLETMIMLVALILLASGISTCNASLRGSISDAPRNRALERIADALEHAHSKVVEGERAK